MRIGVLGTGSVGRAIGDKMLELGHAVTSGSRSADSAPLTEWVEAAGEQVRGGSFAAAAGTEKYLALRLRLRTRLDTPDFKIAVVR